jgi:FHS family L-fucose permease-like MFS transporter
MPSDHPRTIDVTSQTTHDAGSRVIVGLIFFIFFVISFLTNILGPLIPDIIAGFQVSMTMAAVLPFSFFIAYGVMSIPAGFLVERWGEKPLMIASSLAGMAGAMSFAVFPSYNVAIGSLFVMGVAMAVMQVAINPLLRVAGGEEHFAFNSACAQLAFGAASFVSPRIYSYLVTNLEAHEEQRGFLLGLLAEATPANLRWVSIYWLFALIAAAMAILIAAIKLPRVKRTAEESAGALEIYATLFRKPITWLYFISIICYVGSEQGAADWMSEFLYRYHGVDPHIKGAAAVSSFWGWLTAGCFIGMLLLKLFDSRLILIGFSLAALVMLTLALFAPAKVSLIAFPAIGLFASIMWPTLVSLALNSAPSHHGAFAGILCTGIMGGALVPLLIGRVGDAFGLRVGMTLLYLTFGFVLSVGFWAKPLINNALRSNRNHGQKRGPAANI